MRDFKTGQIDRETVPKAIRRFSPSMALDSLEEVDLVGLREAGKDLILLDVDNTLLPWRSRDIPDSTRNWVTKARDLGFRFCVISNTRNPARLEEICSSLDIPFVRAKFKPSRKMYDLALEKFEAQPEQAVMIGDQMLTDIWGANRADIDAIWVRPIGKREFIGTRVVSRNVEGIIGRFLYKYFQADEENTLIAPEKPGLFRHNLVQQFFKFCVVGGTSFAIDAGTHFLLMFAITWDGRPLNQALGQWLIENMPQIFGQFREFDKAATPVLKVPAAALAILNGFYWNRRWTFAIRGSQERFSQLRRYVTIAVVGLFLNTFFTTLFNNIIPGHPKRSLAVATVLAAVIVAFWNFSGQRLWAFRQKS